MARFVTKSNLALLLGDLVILTTLHELKWLTSVSTNGPWRCELEWSGKGFCSARFGVSHETSASVTKKSAALACKSMENAWHRVALTPRSCTLYIDITCQVRLHQWLQRSEDKVPCNMSRNKYQPHRMQPVTVTCAVASNAWQILYIHVTVGRYTLLLNNQPDTIFIKIYSVICTLHSCYRGSLQISFK